MRTYSNVETGEQYQLIYDSVKGAHIVTDAKGNDIPHFYACGFDGVTIRVNSGKEIKLSMSQIYVFKQGEKATHKKYAGFSKFSKI